MVPNLVFSFDRRRWETVKLETVLGTEYSQILSHFPPGVLDVQGRRQAEPMPCPLPLPRHLSFG